MSLYRLSRIILMLHQAPISKVRFARIIYYVHKELIRKKFMESGDIAYIRSPLGPIPEGFLDLPSHPGIISKRRQAPSLSYATEEYAINSEAELESESSQLEQYRDLLHAVERVLKALHNFSTPELIASSHREPSWVTHANGEVYHITPADLKIAFPFTIMPAIRIKIRFKKPSANKAGELQANLLRGMISDIVKESTDLEHPDDSKN